MRRAAYDLPMDGKTRYFNIRVSPRSCTASERTPNPPKPNPLKILHVRGGELGDALGDEGEGAAGVDKFGSTPPH